MAKTLKTAAAAAFLSALLMLGTQITANAEEPSVTIDSVTVSKSGRAEIIGHTSNGKRGEFVSFLSFLTEPKSKEEYNMDNLIGLEQVSTGNNGTFLIQFGIASKYSEKAALFKIGGVSGVPQMFSYEIPKLPPGVEVADNNSVVYGRDIFYIPGALYEADTIAESLAYGGNNIFFKIGGLWYDLMDSRASDNSYLTAENAAEESTVIALKPRYYYGMTERVELEYAIEEESE